MTDAFLSHIRATLDDIEAAGLTKRERLLTGPQGGRIHVASPQGARDAVNLCSNNYLGLADHPDVIAAARRAMDQFGFGMASVRFICGAQTLHRELEQAIAKHLGKADAIVFAACFDANGGVFEPLLGDEDAIISDSLNHASIIDGVRLSKAKRYRFANSDMNELEDRLKEADSAGARFKLIASDGVFSMDGYVAKLKEICALADRYGAMVLVDDCHATGHLRREGPRHAGADRRPRQHRHWHIRQDAWRGHGRLRRRRPADRRSLAPTRAALSVFQFARALRSPPARSRRSRSRSAPTRGAPCSKAMRGGSAKASRRPDSPSRPERRRSFR